MRKLWLRSEEELCVTVKNPNHVEKGVISMIVDGKDVDVSSISGGMIPIALADGKKDVNVEVVMG